MLDVRIRVVWSWISMKTNAGLSVFFFFQAEDGIRDLTVTGVQTCALPISLSANKSRRARTEAAGRNAVTEQNGSARSKLLPTSKPKKSGGVTPRTSADRKSVV